MDLETLWPDLEQRIRERGVRAVARDLGISPMMASRGARGGLRKWPAADVHRLLALFGFRVSIQRPRRGARKAGGQ